MKVTLLDTAFVLPAKSNTLPAAIDTEYAPSTVVVSWFVRVAASVATFRNRLEGTVWGGVGAWPAPAVDD